MARSRELHGMSLEIRVGGQGRTDLAAESSASALTPAQTLLGGKEMEKGTMHSRRNSHLWV